MLLNKGVLTNLKSLRQIDKGVVLLARSVYNIFTTLPYQIDGIIVHYCAIDKVKATNDKSKIHCHVLRKTVRH